MFDFLSGFSFEELFRYATIVVSVFLPILLWGYFFSYLENTAFRAWRFLDGIIGGIFSVAPLFLAKAFGDGFFPIAQIKQSPLFPFPLLVAIITFLLFLLVVGFLFPFFRTQRRRRFSVVFFSRIVPIILIAGVIFVAFSIAIKYFFDIPLHSLSNMPVGVLTVASLILYYVLSSGQEEIIKHTFSLGDMFRPRPTFRSVFFPAFHVALGFGFLENILYLTEFAKSTSIFSMTYLVSTGARSLFSILIHVLCSVILAFAFLRAFSRSEKPLTYGRIYLVGFVSAILIHASYNIVLAFQAQYLLMGYLIGAYMYLTYSFHRTDSEVPFDGFLKTPVPQVD